MNIKQIQPYSIIIVAVLLLGIALGLDTSNRTKANLEHYAERLETYMANSEKEVFEVFDDTTLLSTLVQDEYSEVGWQVLSQLGEKETSFFIYNGDSLVFWSSNRILPVIEEVRTTQKLQSNIVKLNDSRYEIIKKSVVLRGNRYALIALIPIYYGYDIENQHIDNHFAVDNIPKAVRISEENTGTAVSNNNGDVIFHLEAVARFTDYSIHALLVFMYGLGFIFLGAFINRQALRIAQNRTPIIGFAFLVVSIFLIRYISIQLSAHTVFKDIPLFQTLDYVSPLISGSVMGLFINSILVLWVITFFFREVPLKKPSDYGQIWQYFILGGVWMLLLAALFWINYVVRDLVLASNISFDFTNIFRLSEASFLGLISISLLVLAVFLLSFKLIKNITPIKVSLVIKQRVLGVIGGAVIIGYFTNLLPAIIAFLAIFALVYLLLFEQFVKDKKSSLQWLGGWLFIYSAFISVLLLNYNVEKEHQQRVTYAERLAMKRDARAEKQFSIIKKSIEQENIPFNLTNPLIPKRTTLKAIEKINAQNEYLSKQYNLSVHFFDVNGNGRRGEQESYADFEDMIASADSTNDPNLFYWRNETERTYVTKIPATTDTVQLGNIILKYVPRNNLEAVPELLTDRSLGSHPGIDYDYAIYKNGKQTKEKGRSYAEDLAFTAPKNKKQLKFVSKGGRSYLLYNADEATTIVVGKDNEPFLQPISAFSYVFCFLSILTLLITLLSRLIKILPNVLLEAFTPLPSLRNRIQVSVLAIIILTFLTIGLVTFFYFRADSDDYHSSRLGRKARGVMGSTEYWMTVNAKDSAYILDVDALADIHRMDINFFAVNGKLIKASQPEIFDKGLIARQIQPLPFFEMQQKGLKEFTDRENIGTLNYQVAYRAVYDANEDLVGYLGLPYYSERSDFNEDIADFIGALLNAYVALLVIAFIAAFATANSITKPLFELRDKLRQVELGKKNEPLQWDTKDEIGTLIEEYNKMLVELERSANKLATSEREGAWREMAKQVAHEIKNPLTPMKLSIQYLVRAYKARPDDIAPMLKRVSYTLIEQIDSLARIATEFSNFAKMPKAENEYLNINSLITSVYNLFSENDEVDMALDVPKYRYIVLADKEQLMRVFNNVVKNAIQAIPDDRRGDILVQLYYEHEHAIVHVKDNGCGIPEDKRHSVFVPNFTTKNSGTGLGLAISRKIIEHAGGRIYFESVVDVGTSFYIELPVVEDIEDREVTVIEDASVIHFKTD